jgi:hypothetical protein
VGGVRRWLDAFAAAQSDDKRTSHLNPAIDFQYATPQFDPIFSPEKSVPD